MSTVGWMKGLNIKEKQTLNLNSKLWKTFLVLLAAILMFGGPTYAVLVLWRGLDLNYALSMSTGFLLFLVGFSLLVFLVRRKLIS